MKKIIALFITIILLIGLCGCGRAYEEADNGPTSLANGYFIAIKTWGGGGGKTYYIIYAKDTKVMYFYSDNGSYGHAISPLYNTDGTLQVYQGE